MKYKAFLNKGGTTTQVVSLRWDAAWVMIYNPTSDVVFIRAGAQDIPTNGNEDYQCSPQTGLVLPLDGRMFAFALINVGGDIQNALTRVTLLFGDKNETPPTIAAVNSATFLVDNSVTGPMIQDRTITGTKLVLLTVTGAEIANLTVSRNKIGDGAINDTKLAGSSVTNSKIRDNAISEPKFSDECVSTRAIATGAVTSVKIGNGEVATANIANSAVDSNKLASNAVGTTHIQNLSVTDGKINDVAVSKIVGAMIELSRPTTSQAIAAGPTRVLLTWNQAATVDNTNSLLSTSGLDTITVNVNCVVLITLNVGSMALGGLSQIEIRRNGTDIVAGSGEVSTRGSISRVMSVLAGTYFQGTVFNSGGAGTWSADLQNAFSVAVLAV